MMEHNYQLFLALLRTAMTGEPFEPVPSAQEWSELFKIAGQQSVMGVCYTAFSHLSKDQMPPMELLVKWMAEAETIRGLNELLNQEAARLTQLFSEQGRKTAILKGQANARLYPDKLSRQVGDIDIWVEGGKKGVVALLMELGLVTELGSTSVDGKPTASYHHVHLRPTKDHIIVEVHFRPSSGNFNPFTNRRLQRWLEQEIASSCQPVDEGFNVPSVRFALMMQLSHVQRHFLVGGIGLRHVCDYYWLLKNSTEEDRREVASHLSSFGLRFTASALMWVLHEVLHLDEDLMLCPPDSYRGEWMLREIMAGGNFGHHAEREKHGTLRRVMEGRLRHLKLMRFDFWEEFWVEVNFCKAVITTLPTRIRYRTLSLRDIPR
ncbi:MAG: nucleotidyltransferase family protein [Prevotella sp.]|nr:nucleotidyltransferase family protein [Prevotella sp.]